MAEAQQDSGAKKRKAMAVVGAVVLVGLAAGALYSQYRKTHITTDDAFIEGNVHTVSSRIAGSVRTVAVSDNQEVRQGDLLVELDPADYRSKAAAARANLELQRAQFRFAERELKRAAALFEGEVSPAERHDKAVAAHEIARAQVALAEEQLRQAELNLGYTSIAAPADGVVTKKSVQPGNQVQAGQPLMAVVARGTLWVVANFKETQLERIRPGQQVTFTVDSYPGKEFRGVVDSIMAGTGASFSIFPAENATGNYVKVVQRVPVKIRIEGATDPGHDLRIGMSVVPTVIAK